MPFFLICLNVKQEVMNLSSICFQSKFHILLSLMHIDSRKSLLLGSPPQDLYLTAVVRTTLFNLLRNKNQNIIHTRPDNQSIHQIVRFILKNLCVVSSKLLVDDRESHSDPYSPSMIHDYPSRLASLCA